MSWLRFAGDARAEGIQDRGQIPSALDTRIRLPQLLGHLLPLIDFVVERRGHLLELF